ncbi:hypothetical protein Bca52824_032911 [Brassica carinata]|uniref:Uncharacterized protein n=1 Tax=Brassica carinata TaxID=52824 RepID=A0A8X7V5K5_BRACI|nr:hypothetical protein Bca52824_032911 [Brassica carinata]
MCGMANLKTYYDKGKGKANCQSSEDDEEDEEEYDYNEWHDFVSRNCEWDDGKDEEGGAAGGQSGGRTNKSNVGVRGEVAPRKAVGGKTADQSRSNGGGSSGKKHGRDELKAKSSFEEYIDDGREYIVTSRSCLGGIDDDDFVESNHPEVVLVTPPKESNQHRREVLVRLTLAKFHNRVCGMLLMMMIFSILYLRLLLVR